MKMVVVSGFGIVLLAIQASAQPACHKAGDDDHAHGANEIIEYSARTVREINGIVTDITGAVMNDVVVEAYSYNKSEDRLAPYRIANSRARIAAALTDISGNFCFRDLNSGRYVLRIGTRQSAGFQEIFLKLRLDRHLWSRWLRFNKRLRIKLPIGT